MTAAITVRGRRWWWQQQQRGGDDCGDGDGNNDDEERRAVLPDVPGSLVQQLVDMGFSEVRARNALLRSRMNLARAAEYALTHNGPEEDVPITAEQYQRIAGSSRSSGGGARLVVAMTRARGILPEDALPLRLPKDIDPSGVERVRPFWMALLADPRFRAALAENAAVRRDFRRFLEDPLGFSSPSQASVTMVGPILVDHRDLL